MDYFMIKGWVGLLIKPPFKCSILSIVIKADNWIDRPIIAIEKKQEFYIFRIA